MLLDEERYASVIEYGRDAVIKINEGNLKEGFESADKGWDAFPESGAKWNQGYGYAKSFFNKAIENNDLVNAKIWLERMTENNDNLHNFDEELEEVKTQTQTLVYWQNMKGKYAYESGDLDKAFEIWQKLVKIKAVSYRYFEYDDPKYKEFYKSRR